MRTQAIDDRGVDMVKSAKQELVIQIERLQAILKEYEKERFYSTESMDTQSLTRTIEQIERRISELQIKLEVMVAIALFYPYKNRPSERLTVGQLSA
jgi:hypothetical protein